MVSPGPSIAYYRNFSKPLNTFSSSYQLTTW